MATSEKDCCVLKCPRTRQDKTVLHSFPNPDKDMDRFMAWFRAVGLDTSLDPYYVYHNRRVCHAHFELKYLTWSKRLSPGSIPTLLLPGSEMDTTPQIDITKGPENVSQDAALSSTSEGCEMSRASQIDITNRPENVSLVAAFPFTSRDNSRKLISDLNMTSYTQPKVDVTCYSVESSYQSDGQDNSKLCRVCGKNNSTLIHLFSKEATHNNLVQKINKYLPIVVDLHDKLPLGVCQPCVTAVLNWHSLVQCCIKTDKLLASKLKHTSKLQNSEESNYKPNGENSTRNDDIKARWTPHWEQSRSDHSEYIHEYDTHDFGETDGLVSDDDDQPLANIATKKLDVFQNFYRALKNFRNHFMEEHDRNSCPYSDFSDSSVSENEDTGAGDLNSFDDLTQNNMRKDKMDEETRLELSQVQTKVNGKVYFTCRTCGKNLSSTHTYIYHKRIHTGERPCVCHVCGKQFRAPNGLQRHLTETHERQRRYICVVCTKNFANSQNLKQHIRIHTGERPYVCPQCGKRFTQSGSLHVHLKTHGAHFPHACAECGARFRLRSGLARHRLRHSGERPHACSACGKAFRQRHELAAHTLTHSDSKPHACDTCGSAFRQRRALRHHCKRLHDTHVTHDTRATHETHAPHQPGGAHPALSYNHGAHYE